MKDERKFKESIMLLCELHDKKFTDVLASIYWEALKPFTDEQCERAFKEVTLTTRFFPKPVEFLEVLRGKEEDRAARAWVKVVEAVRRIGNYQSVQFDDRIIHAVFKFWGGWGVTADWKEAELKWKQKEFERLYSIMAQNDNHPAYLPGAHEIENSARGFNIQPEVIRIGFDGHQKQITTLGAVDES